VQITFSSEFAAESKHFVQYYFYYGFSKRKMVSTDLPLPEILWM